jgi:hypothetical protein
MIMITSNAAEISGAFADWDDPFAEEIPKYLYDALERYENERHT